MTVLDREQFLASLAHELRVLTHLHGKLDLSRLDERPGDNTRAHRELLGYISMCAVTPTEALIRGDWSGVASRQERAKQLDPAEFPAVLEAQLAEVRELLERVSDEELRTKQVSLPWGVELPLGAALVETALKFTCAYRHELFLRIKIGGRSELTTYDAWAGVDTPASS